jgi:2-C-methyl-D-erythritol 4-phosphate cytidylyltransferase/2-C-methyl-D-erythritol 2,4-cyclodiphosphate synthase
VRIHGIVVAAGRGSRYGGPKHGIALDGIALWERALRALHAGGIPDVVVVGDVPGGVPGGERRRDSVLAGLEALPDDAEGVLVHDAARPLASPELVARVRERLAAGDADGVVPVVPLRDTIKRVAGERVVETVERSDLAAAQTPQGFRVAALRAAHAADPSDVSDDAVLVERNGGPVVAVPGEVGNLKITFAGDLELARALLP